MKQILFTFLLFLVTHQATASLRLPRLMPFELKADITNYTLGGNGTFDQYLDHDNPHLGTFKQWFWYNTTWWGGPGSPVYLFTPGEIDGASHTGWLTEWSLIGKYAQLTGGATVMLEHRYFGESTPFSVLDTQNLTYLTLKNSLADFAHFAQTVKLPFDTTGKSSPENAPWTFIGGSYAGMLSAWMQKFHPGIFWAFHSSSAPVQAIYKFWNYFTPIEKGMPRNCSDDALLIADHLNAVYSRGLEAEIHDLKDMFGLAELEHFDDFAMELGMQFVAWQGISPSTGYSRIFEMCDTIEGARDVPISVVYLNETTTTVATRNPATSSLYPSDDRKFPTGFTSGIGLEKALANFAAWYKNKVLPGACSYGYPEWADPLSVACRNTHNASSPMYTDWSSVRKGGYPYAREWNWMLCNEPFAFWMGGPPSSHRGLMSHVVTPEFQQRQCRLWFPPAPDGTLYGSANGVRTVDTVNRLTGGWNPTNTTRVIWTAGEFDPWRHGSVTSPDRPGGPMISTPANPVFLIPGAVHGNELRMANGDANAEIRAVQEASIEIMKQWVADYYTARDNQTSTKE
ncbi:putative extracellular serine carboxypeptidase [Podospora conica]|nr:putative extracellular serine carboxypeptidase [Schizothecium conicum]